MSSVAPARSTRQGAWEDTRMGCRTNITRGPRALFTLRSEGPLCWKIVPSLRITPRLSRTLSISLIAVLAVLYAVAWFAPAIGLAYYEGEALVAAKTGALAGLTSPP